MPLGGDTLQSYLGLAQTVSPENVSRVECDAGQNVTLTNPLQWFNTPHFAQKPFFTWRLISTPWAGAAALADMGVQGAEAWEATAEARGSAGLLRPPAASSLLLQAGKPAESWVF